MERGFKLLPSYDGRDHPRNYGIGAMRMYWWIKGPKGAISITMFTSWFLPHLQLSSFTTYSTYPFGALEHLMQPHLCSIDYHSFDPSYEGQNKSSCDLIEGGCYCDGTSLWFGEAWMEGFLHGGSEWLYARMEDLYRNVWEGGPEVDLTPIPVTFGD